MDKKQNSENQAAYSAGGSTGPGAGGASDYSDGYYDTPTGGGKIGTGKTTSGKTPGEGEVGDIAGGNKVEGRMAINGAGAEVSEPTGSGQGTGDMATGGNRAENLGGTAGGGSHPGTGLLPEQIKQNPPE